MSQLIDKENLLEKVKKALNEGKEVAFIKTWTGLHVVGNRRFHNLSLVVEVDGAKILDADYESDISDVADVEDAYDEVKEKVFDMMRDEALNLLCEKLGFHDIEELEKEAELWGDDEGNPMVRLENGKRYTAVFCHFHLHFYTGKDIETFVFHKPKLMELKDC